MPGVSVCRSCGAPIRWVETDRDRRMPLDPEAHLEGNLVVVVEGGRTIARMFQPLFDVDAERYRSHFVTCPNADQHRKPRG